MPEEDDVDGIATDEPRPRKKTKSAIDPGSCTGKAGNGRITSLSVGTLPWVLLIVVHLWTM